MVFLTKLNLVPHLTRFRIIAQMFLALIFIASIEGGFAAPTSSYVPEFASCDPLSELSDLTFSHEMSSEFCSQWNPDFQHNRKQCCGPLPRRGKRRRFPMCSQQRVRQGFCSEVTQEQKLYMESVTQGKIEDILAEITESLGKSGDQAFCTVNNGFLVNGRPVVATEKNRIHIQVPSRCTHYGTDSMTGMLEWLGREVAKEYSQPEYAKAHLLIGDISGPRGGCLFGSSGKRRHASHTSGQDADVGFLAVRPNQSSPSLFHTQFEPQQNWWFLKKVFKNPFACIKVVFLDRRHIAKLATKAKYDPDWKNYSRFIRHMPGHHNHFHIRIGNGPGPVGCSPAAHPELEFEDDEGESIEAVESSVRDELDRLKTRQSSTIQNRL